MDEAPGDPSLAAGEKLQSASSPHHESRLAALRRADNIVLQGGSPSSSRSDLSWPHSPHARSPEALDPSRAASPRFRSTSGHFTRSATLPRKGRGRIVITLLKRGGIFCFVLLFLGFAFDWWVLSRFQRRVADLAPPQADTVSVREDGPSNRSSAVSYGRLLALAAHGLAESEFKSEPHELWEEPIQSNSTWLPCANQRPKEHISPPLPKDSTGYIIINANGDTSQQRIAICNAVAVARLLNATLVLPKFTSSNLRRDSSQFKDLFVDDYFIEYLKDDVRVVKELPANLKALNLGGTEAVVAEIDVPKEAKPSFYLQHILPLLLKMGVVLFDGFDNRLAFDPVPSDIQTLRCRCNFHALRFVPELERVGKLIAERMRDQHPRWGPRDDEFEPDTKPRIRFVKKVPKYMAVHTEFDMDMERYRSLCESPKEQLRGYLEDHLPRVEQDERLELAELQGELGVCPLLPEEGFLVLAALGYKRATRMYLAGADLPSWQAKMASFKFLYPNVVTKEDLLSEEELQPFRDHPSQLEVLDYIACSLADSFFVTDSGSQLSSLVAGQRMYHSSGHGPTLYPVRNLVAPFLEQSVNIEWSHFQDGVQNALQVTNRRRTLRHLAQSVYRHPRCLECMCEHRHA